MSGTCGPLPNSSPEKFNIQTAVEADALLGRIGTETAIRDILAADMAKELAAVRTKFEPGIAKVQDSIADKLSALEDWADASREQFGEKKSIELLHGRIGFRSGNPHLELLSKMTWKKVLARLKGKLKRYIREKPEVDRAALLADASRKVDPLPASMLSRAGVRLAQDESFFHELKNS